MFTWICPQCGREVPPAYTECPDCANKTAQGGGAPGAQPPAPGAVDAPPPPPTRTAPPSVSGTQEFAPPQYPPVQPQYQPPYPGQPPYPYPTQQFYPPQQPYQGQQPYPPPQPGYPPQQPPYGQPPYPPQGYPPHPYPPQAYPGQPGYPPQPPYPPQSASIGAQGSTASYTFPPPAESAPPKASPESYSPPPRTEPAPASPEPYSRPSRSPSFLGPLNAEPSSAPYSPPAEAPPERRHLPTWLMTIVFAIVFVGIVWGIYSLVHTGGSSSTAAVVPAAAKTDGKVNVYQQYIEVSGVRFTADAKKKPVVKFVVTNHSDAEIQGLAAHVTVLAHTQKSDTPVGTFTFKTDLRPNESKDLSEPLDTQLPMVELPDWQFVKTDLQVTAPGA